MSIACSNLSFAYNGRPILSDLSFSLRAGKITALLGRNGAGKSTLMHCVAGLEKTTEGELSVDGLNLRTASRRAIARSVSLVGQEHTAIFPFSVKEVVAMGRTPHLSFFSSPSCEDYAEAEKALQEIGASDLQNQIFTQLSGGQKQLVLLARALVQSKKVMLLDEPTNHLDYRNRYQMLHLLRSISDNYGSTILMSLHEPNHALHFADDVLLMRSGKIIAHGPVEEVMNSDSMSMLYDLPVRHSSTGSTRAFSPCCIAGEEPRLLILTGESGTGKTTLLEWLVDRLKQQGTSVAGVLCPGEMENGIRTSFDLRNISTGEETLLGARTTAAEQRRFTFSEDGLAAAKSALSCKACSDADVVIVDEVGPMEIKGRGFHSSLSSLLALPCVHIWVVRPSLVEAVSRHWLVSNPVVVNVNDDTAVSQVLSFVGTSMEACG